MTTAAKSGKQDRMKMKADVWRLCVSIAPPADRVCCGALPPSMTPLPFDGCDVSAKIQDG